MNTEQTSKNFMTYLRMHFFFDVTLKNYNCLIFHYSVGVGRIIIKFGVYTYFIVGLI